MHCSACGHSLSDTDYFCSVCGQRTKYNAQAAPPQEPVSAKPVPCAGCGAPLPLLSSPCVNCGRNLVLPGDPDPNDRASPLAFIVSLFLPVVGVALTLVWWGNKPQQARSALRGLLCSILFGLFFFWLQMPRFR